MIKDYTDEYTYHRAKILFWLDTGSIKLWDTISDKVRSRYVDIIKDKDKTKGEHVSIGIEVETGTIEADYITKCLKNLFVSRGYEIYNNKTTIDLEDRKKTILYALNHIEVEDKYLPVHLALIAVVNEANSWRDTIIIEKPYTEWLIRDDEDDYITNIYDPDR